MAEIIRSQAVIIGENLIAASTGVLASSNRLILTGWEGWDEAPEIERTTSPRLFGDGEVFSRLSSFKAKTFSISFIADLPNSTNVRTVRTAIMQVAQRLNDTTTVSMVYYTDGQESFREELQALPAEDFISELEQQGNRLLVTLEFYAPSPWKTVYLNGSSTPESDKRL